MNNIVFALITPDPLQTNQLGNKLRELTIAWSRYGYHGEIIESNSIDQALEYATQVNADYCLVQSTGHIIDEQWYLSHWQQEGFYQGLERLIKTEQFLIAGDWFNSSHNCIGLKTDCFLINLNHYISLKNPQFGQADGKIRSMQQGQLSAKLNDQLIATDDFEKCTTDAAGWHLIQSSLKHNIPVIRFSSAINQCRFDLAYKAKENNFDKLIGQPINNIDQTSNLSHSQKTFIKRIKKQLSDAQKGAFLFNIESYEDLVTHIQPKPLDAVFSVAAGFKPYRILFSQGHHDNTQVIFFDYSRKALQIRRYIAENWNGRDFPSFVRQIFKRFPEKDVFYQLWYGATPNSLDWQDMEHLWQQELTKWGGADKFEQHWLQCHKLPHQYIHCDLLQNRQVLLDEISRYPNSYIWWSNAFFTIFSHWHYSPTERKKQYLQWITDLSVSSPACQINGADHNNIAVNGLSALTYRQQFNQTECDELTPQKIHSIDIQF